MFAQDVIPRRPIGLDANLPNSGQRDLWDKAVTLLDRLSDRSFMAGLLSVNAGAAWFYLNQQGIETERPDELEQRVLAVETKLDEITALMRKVEDHDLGLAFRNGDFDIVEPETVEGISGIVVVLVVAGVVVATGIISRLIYIERELDEITPRYNNLLTATDNVFRDQGPEAFERWEAYKTESGYTRRETMAEQITSGLARTAQTGAKWGLAIGIPLLIALLWRK